MLVPLLRLSSWCHVTFSVFDLFLTVMWVGLLYVIVVFPGHNTFFRFRSSVILIVIDDLPISLGNVIPSVDLYADDTTLYDIGLDKNMLENNLQQALNFLKIWCLENGMIINIDKTKLI